MVANANADENTGSWCAGASRPRLFASRGRTLPRDKARSHVGESGLTQGFLQALGTERGLRVYGPVDI